MAAASDSYERSPGQRFQGRAISPINEENCPISRARAKEIVTQAEGDCDAFRSPRYSPYITSDEQLAIRVYFQDHLPVAGLRTTSRDNAQSDRGAHSRSANGNRS